MKYIGNKNPKKNRLVLFQEIDLNAYVKTLLCLCSIACTLSIHGQSLVWTFGIGGANDDEGVCIDTDEQGNVVSTGNYPETTDFDPGVLVHNLPGAPAGYDNSYVLKVDGSGNFIWAIAIEGDMGVKSRSLSMDNWGNVYVTGEFEGTVDLDPSSSLYTFTAESNSKDVFVVKYDASGNFVWGFKIGGTGSDGVGDIDWQGNKICITGSFDFECYFNGTTQSLTPVGLMDAYVAQYDDAGNFIWAKQISGSNNEEGKSISTDVFGNVYSLGNFEGASQVDFDPGNNIFSMSPAAGSYDAYITKFDGSGAFVWARQLGGSDLDRGYSIKVDNQGNVITTGFFSGQADFDPGAGNVSFNSSGFRDMFISKLDNNGNFIWANQIAGASYEESRWLDIDNYNNIFITGFFAGTTDFDPGAGVYNLTATNPSFTEIFVTKIASSGSLVWAQSMGGSNKEFGQSIAVDPLGECVYTTGRFEAIADFDPGTNVFNLNSNGDEDLYVHKMCDSSLILSTEIYSADILVFPNPTANFFTLQSEDNIQSIYIMNPEGKMMIEKKQINTNSLSVNLADLHPGVYSLCVQFKNNTEKFYKLIKVE